MTSKKIAPHTIHALLLVIVFWLLAVMLNVWERLRGDYGWRWGYLPPDNVWRVLPIAIGVVIYSGVGLWLIHRSAARWLLAWAVLCGSGLVGGAIYTHHTAVSDTLYLRTLSSGVTGWHYAGVLMEERGVDKTLETWPAVMADMKLYSAHVAISPPGMALGYYELNRLFEDVPAISDRIGPPLRAEQCHDYRYNDFSNPQFTTSGLGGWLSPWIALLVVIPLYALGKRYFSEQATRWAVLWWPLVPAVLLFQPYPSVIYPTLTIPTTLALLVGLTQNQRHWVFIAGLMMSVVTFINFSILPLLLVAGLLALGIFFTQWKQKSWHWWWPIEMGIWYGLGLLVVWIAYYILYGVTFFEILDATFNSHLDLERDYWPWLFLHVYDFGFFLGWPMLVFGLIGLWQAIRAQKNTRNFSPATVVGSAVVFTLLILVVSGTARGETGRVWLFFMPYMLLWAGTFVVQQEQPRVGWLLTVVQASIVVGLAAFIPTIGIDLTSPPPTPTWPAASPTTYIQNGSVYDDTITLQSFAGVAEPIEDEDYPAVLKLWIRWTSAGYVEQPYYIGILPIAPDGSAQTAYVAQPFNDGHLPMTCWLPERGIIEDYYEIPLATYVAGEWWASVQILSRNGNILIVAHPDGTLDQQTGIGGFLMP